MVHGGGACASNKDCGNFGPDFDNPEKTGGKCEGGMCVCFEGYTCPHCTTGGSPESVVKGDLQCKDGAVRSGVCVGMLALLGWVAYLLLLRVCDKQGIIHGCSGR